MFGDFGASTTAPTDKEEQADSKSGKDDEGEEEEEDKLACQRINKGFGRTRTGIADCQL